MNLKPDYPQPCHRCTLDAHLTAAPTAAASCPQVRQLLAAEQPCPSCSDSCKHNRLLGSGCRLLLMMRRLLLLMVASQVVSSLRM
jgi:hypothetical protein